MAPEEIAHKVIKEDGDIQIRAYEETIVAEVQVKGERREAPGIAFRTLFNYIRGANITSREISMTAPVSQKAVSQKIPMTAPVSQQKSGEKTWSIAFYMPNDMSFETTPKPTNERITIRRISARNMAAIRFSGTSSNNNMYKHERELRRYLNKNNISFSEPPLYAFYDNPMVPWFLRRNEVLFELE